MIRTIFRKDLKNGRFMKIQKNIILSDKILIRKGSESIRKEPESWVVQRFYNDKFQISEKKKI
jgi:hypothetical protein